MKKKEKKDDDLSCSLKKNLQLRKKQISERDNKNIIGKRTNKIGLSRLSLDTSNKKFRYKMRDFPSYNSEKIFITGGKKLNGKV